MEYWDLSPGVVLAIELIRLCVFLPLIGLGCTACVLGILKQLGQSYPMKAKMKWFGFVLGLVAVVGLLLSF